MDERTLVSASQRGDLEAFNRLVELYQSQVYNLALRMLGDADAAEDATQEAFISAWQAVRGFRGESFRAWLLAIASNACRDVHRRAKRRPQSSLELMSEEGFAPPSPPAAHPEQQAIQREVGEEIARGLSLLPREQRLAVVLIDIQGFSYEETAQAMRSSVGTVKSRLSRGRSRLRNYLLSRPELLPESYRHIIEKVE